MSAGFSNGLWEADGLSVKVSGRGVIANVPTPQNGGVMECVANANLIAAAPKLYSVLELLLAVTVSLKFERGDGPPIASDAAYDIAVNAARSALAKARGEQVQS